MVNKSTDNSKHLAQEIRSLKEELEKTRAEKNELKQQLEQLQKAPPDTKQHSRQKGIAEELHQSRVSYRLINKVTHDIIWDWDLKTNRLQWNHAVEAAVGKNREELSPDISSWHRHIHPGDQARVAESIRQAIDEGNEFWSMEYRFGPEEGPWRDYFDRGYIARDARGKAWRMIGSMIDLTERKKAEQALLYNEKLLQDILQVLPVGIFISDEKGSIAKTNRAAEKIWGGAKNIPINQLKEYRGWWRKTGKRIESDEWAFARAFLQGESSVDEEIDIECFDGTRKTILNFAVPVKNKEGKILSAVAVSMDITNRIKAEEALQENEERLKAALEGSNLGSWDLDLTTGQSTRSLRHDQIWGYPEGKATWGFEDAMNQVYPDDRPLIQKAYEKAYKTGFLYHENRIIWPNGTIRWIAASGSIRFDKNKNPVRVTGVVEDITERKKDVEELRMSEERFRKALQIDTVGVLFFDMESHFLNANDAFLRMIGYSREDLNRGVLNSKLVTLPEWMPRTWQAFTELKATGLFNPYEKQLVRPDGTRWWGLFAGTRLNENEAFEFVIDVTERKQAEQALQENEEKFRLMANNISQLAWMADNQGKIFWYNQRWFDFTGTTLEEMQGWGWKKVHHPRHIDRVVKKIKQSFDSGKVWEDTFPLRSKEGKYHWFLSRAIPFKDTKGNIVQWFGTNTDVTRQREYEELLKRDNELFEDLLYITAHDLKGPIANMYLALDLIHKAESHEKMKLLDHFGGLVERLETTITGVTDILKVRKTDESASAVLNFEDVLKNILPEFNENSSLSSLNSNFQKKTIRYVEPFLYSILKNLISNAIKYSRDDVPLKIEITTLPEGEYTLLIIRDNGIGIDLNRHGNQLFSPFQRINPSKAKGTGVGLYIIKKIIEKNGGYIEIKSTSGKGTAFYCYLKEY